MADVVTNGSAQTATVRTVRREAPAIVVREGRVSVSAERTVRRHQLESLVGSDIEHLILNSDRRSRTFAEQHTLTAHALRALVIVVGADMSGDQLTAGDLCRQLRMSQAATSGLIAQLTESGHVHRDIDPADRRKVILRHTERGMTVARAFLVDVTQHVRHTLWELPDSDLEAVHRALSALVDGSDPSSVGPVSVR